jgi:uncharacterized damage-inducible protein DinB
MNAHGPEGPPPLETPLVDELRQAWRTNNRINLLLIDHISDEGMLSTLSTRGGRNVARQFAHLHNVRVWHLERRRSKDLAAGLEKFDGKVSPPKSALRQALSDSCEAVERFLVDLLTGENDRRGFKRGIFTTLAYFIAHESHHRGSILLTLKQCGHGVDKPVAYGIWDWDRR